MNNNNSSPSRLTSRLSKEYLDKQFEEQMRQYQNEQEQLKAQSVQNQFVQNQSIYTRNQFIDAQNQSLHSQNQSLHQTDINESELEEICEVFRLANNPVYFVEGLQFRYQIDTALTKEDWYRFHPQFLLSEDCFEMWFDMMVHFGFLKYDGYDKTYRLTPKFAMIAPKIISKLKETDEGNNELTVSTGKGNDVNEDIFDEEEVLQVFLLLPDPLKFIKKMKGFDDYIGKNELKIVTRIPSSDEFEEFFTTLLSNGIIKRSRNGYCKITKLFNKIDNEAFKTKLMKRIEEMEAQEQND